MSPEERRAYDNYLDTLVRDTDVMKTKLLEAEIAGMKKGMEKGIAMAEEKARKEKLEAARKLKAMNLMTIERIADVTSLTPEDIEAL